MPRPNARRVSYPPARAKARRASYDLAFKTHVVETALNRPTNNRIKPTCALFPGIEPCQVRQHRTATPRALLMRSPPSRRSQSPPNTRGAD